MRPGRLVILVWVGLIVILLIVELAEITHLFALPIQSAIGDPLGFVFALVFTTILALVGAVFLGIYFSSRMLNPAGFTPFEEEMLRMRKEVQELGRSVEEIRRTVAPTPPDTAAARPPEEDP